MLSSVMQFSPGLEDINIDFSCPSALDLLIAIPCFPLAPETKTLSDISHFRLSISELLRF